MKAQSHELKSENRKRKESVRKKNEHLNEIHWRHITYVLKKGNSPKHTRRQITSEKKIVVTLKDKTIHDKENY